ncbi:hypothetical protein CEXT_188921 [Caerostris extrusa]|uniref:Uncharacterized protein n=1 Tax=Caerostris extrusa TaxID=172846 RepID=A0AAV4NMW5_CAEEX|nr:hypothetical protein CEXT_188921 [Caerostris extrusa]
MTAFFLHSEKGIQHTQKGGQGPIERRTLSTTPTEERGAPIHVKIALQTKKNSLRSGLSYRPSALPGSTLALLPLLSGIQWRENDLAECGRPWRSTRVAKCVVQWVCARGLLADDCAKVGCPHPQRGKHPGNPGACHFSRQNVAPHRGFNTLSAIVRSKTFEAAGILRKKDSPGPTHRYYWRVTLNSSAFPPSPSCVCGGGCYLAYLMHFLCWYTDEVAKRNKNTRVYFFSRQATSLRLGS